jgi:hypothetical protein
MIQEGLRISGKVTVRSHAAGTIDRYNDLVERSRIYVKRTFRQWLLRQPASFSHFDKILLAEANALIKSGKIETTQKNLIVDSSLCGIDILIQYLISGYTGTNPFPLGIAWGEIGAGIAPGSAPSVATGSSGLLTGAYQYLVTFLTAAGETTAGPASATVNPSSQEVALTTIPTGISGTVTGRNIYRTKAGGSTFFLLTTISDNTTTTYTDNTTDGSLPSTQPPTVSTAGSISPATTDTALQAPTNRASVSSGLDYGFNEAQLQFFFPDTVLANQTYYEFGTFFAGTSTIGSGNMFNHALFSSPYSKSAGSDSTIELDLSISNS